MNPRGPDIRTILDEALDRPPGPGREAYLDEVSGRDTELRLRLEDLLAAHGRLTAILGPPGAGDTEADAVGTHEPTAPGATLDHHPGPGDPGATTPSAGSDEGLGPGDVLRYFGDYEIRRELGRGGMGVVYEARQVSLNRPVALKMVRAGLLAGDDELRRFRNEAEAVALLDHPGIVPVHEVGEHAGQHFFSMKLVSGGSLVPLLERYRDDPRAAAKLLAEAAEAVAHAHARGILHRDLKPANILVDAEGRPHVTDFGLAKKVESDVEFTQSGAILGTPAYMSPEQASGRRGSITTATDVYGLGALLYALLTGQAPFGGDSVVETIDAVRNNPPEPPRKLNATLPRDLETICLKCLEKDPRRRYPTAQAVADELKAWLESRPIAARRVGPAERAWLWCKRRPAVAALSAAVLLATVAGTATVIAVQARANADLRAANQRVEQRYNLAVDAIQTFHTGVSEDFLLREPQFRELRDRLLNSAAEFYGKLGALLRAEDDRASRRALAESNFQLAGLTAKIGRLEDAVAMHRPVLAERRVLAAAPGSGVREVTDVAVSLIGLGRLLDALGKQPEALGSLREAETLLAGTSNADRAALGALAECRSMIGAILSASGKPAEALATYRLARADHEALAGVPDAPADLRSELSQTIERIALLLQETERPAESEAEHRKALAILEDLVARHPNNVGFRSHLAANHHLLGMLLGDTGKLTEAERHHRRAIALLEELMKSHPALGDPRSIASNTWNDLAYLLVVLGRSAEAEAAYRRAADLGAELVERNPTAVHLRHGLATIRNNFAMLLQSRGRLAEAEEQQRGVVELFESLLAGTPESAALRTRLAISRKNLGLVLTALDRLGEAEAEYRRALDVTSSLAAAETRPGSLHASRATCRQSLATLLNLVGRGAEAEAECREALSVFEAMAAANPTFTDHRSRLAGCLNVQGALRLSAGQLAEAEARFRRALTLYRALGQENPKAQAHQIGGATSEVGLAEIERRSGRLAESLATIDRSVKFFETLTREDLEKPALVSGLASALRQRGLTRQRMNDLPGAAEDTRRALALLEGLAHRRGEESLAAACCHATLAGLAGAPAGERDVQLARATQLLEQAVASGYRNAGYLRTHDGLDTLRGHADFERLLMDLAVPTEPFVPGRPAG